MPTSEQTAGKAKESNFTDEDMKLSYEKGLKRGRIEGMIAYQKKLIDNLQRDNEKLAAALAAL